MSPIDSSVPIDEKTLDSYRDLIKKVKNVKIELVKTTDEIEALYAEVCQKIVRQDVQRDLQTFIQQCEQFRDKIPNEAVVLPEIIENSQQELRELRLAAVKLMSDVENYFNEIN